MLSSSSRLDPGKIGYSSRYDNGGWSLPWTWLSVLDLAYLSDSRRLGLG